MVNSDESGGVFNAQGLSFVPISELIVLALCSELLYERGTKVVFSAFDRSWSWDVIGVFGFASFINGI
jgi:hypothetical protein